MRIVEIPIKTLEDEIISLSTLDTSIKGEEFILGAQTALMWLAEGKISPTDLLVKANAVGFKQ